MTFDRVYAVVLLLLVALSIHYCESGPIAAPEKPQMVWGLP